MESSDVREVVKLSNSVERASMARRRLTARVNSLDRRIELVEMATAIVIKKLGLEIPDTEEQDSA